MPFTHRIYYICYICLTYLGLRLCVVQPAHSVTASESDVAVLFDPLQIEDAVQQRTVVGDHGGLPDTPSRAGPVRLTVPSQAGIVRCDIHTRANRTMLIPLYSRFGPSVDDHQLAPLQNRKSYNKAFRQLSTKRIEDHYNIDETMYSNCSIHPQTIKMKSPYERKLLCAMLQHVCNLQAVPHEKPPPSGWRAPPIQILIVIRICNHLQRVESISPMRDMITYLSE